MWQNNSLKHDDDMGLARHWVSAFAVYSEVIVAPEDLGACVILRCPRVALLLRKVERRSEWRGRVRCAMQAFRDDAAHGAARSRSEIHYGPRSVSASSSMTLQSAQMSRRQRRERYEMKVRTNGMSAKDSPQYPSSAENNCLFEVIYVPRRLSDFVLR